jgi:hypothetical protein
MSRLELAIGPWRALSESGQCRQLAALVNGSAHARKRLCKSFDRKAGQYAHLFMRCSNSGSEAQDLLQTASHSTEKTSFLRLSRPQVRVLRNTIFP